MARPETRIRIAGGMLLLAVCLGRPAEHLHRREAPGPDEVLIGGVRHKIVLLFLFAVVVEVVRNGF